MSRVVIFGTGSFAQVAHYLLNHDSDHDVAAFTVNESHLTERELMGLPVISFEEIERQFPPDAFSMLVAVGYKDVNRLRATIYTEAKSKGYDLISYVSSKCTNWSEAIGDNCFIFEDNTIQPFVTIGNDVVMWSGNHIGHHATIGDHCFIASHVVVSGHVQVGAYTFLGVNATLRDNISIGEGSIVGAGALVMKSTTDKAVYITERTRPDRRTSDNIPL